MISARAATIAILLAGCSTPRDVPPGGEHPQGWADPSSANFHALYLRATGDHLDACQQCHGTNFEGGSVGVACTSSGCHTQPGGPAFCGTCHGGINGPLPATNGAHTLHAAYCKDCHDVPTSWDDPGHITGKVRVVFSGLATTGGAKPTFDPGTMTCSGVYCHVDQSPVWKTPPATIPCNDCHGDPPANHQAWSRVATPSSCATCHPVPPAATHVDGKVELNASIACDTCHGQDPSGAPPVGLDGATSPTAPSVGAHVVHLSENLPGRMGHVVACATCHTVPASVTSPGHLDHPLPATVSLPQGGTYTPGAQACTVWCHWDKTPGPSWTDDSGAWLKCDACHGFPPVLTRDGTPHTASPPELSACEQCHPFSPTTHVDGIVEILP